MTTYPLPTLAPTVDANGITAPAYPDILASLQATYRSIFGTDVYLDPDSQDGEFLAIFARAQSDVNNAVVSSYRNYAPTTAEGAGLSSAVKINGIQRDVATNSTAPVAVVGTAGTIITNGQVGDDQNLFTKWDLPARVTIPSSGTITVTATCTTQGATLAGVNTLTQILTPTRGWQTVTNASAATAGAPVESDATLRQRQASSTALPSLSVFDGVLAGIKNISGVTRAAGYENSSSTTDANGVPGHSIEMVVEGGSVTNIAQTILDKKTPGTGTHGGTSEIVTDQYGIPSTIYFDVLGYTDIYVAVTITALTGYLSTTADAMKKVLAYYVSNLLIGGDVFYSKLYPPANLSGSAAQTATGLTQAQLDALSATFDITALTVGTSATPTGTSDVVIAFNKAARLSVADVTITVSP